MADNFNFSPGTGATGAADDIDGVMYPRVKLVLGANNSNDGDVASGNPMPVTGTITAVTAITNALPAGTNAIGKLSANSGVDIGDVDVTSCALPTGASTAANQSTIIGHIDGVETLLGTIDADTGNIATAVQLIDNAISGTEMQVDVVASLPAGTNNIGDVDIASAIPAGTNNIGDVDVLTLPATPAGTNLIGRVSASAETSTVYNGTTALTPKFAVIDHATSGNNTIVTAVADKKIRVHQCVLNVAADVTIRFESGADGTALSGQFQVKAGSGFVLPFSPMGWFETGVNTLLNLELSGAVSVDGVLGYTEV
jgi:hypothetical protein